MESLPTEVKQLVAALRTQIDTDSQRVAQQTAETCQLVAQLEQKLANMKEEHEQVLSAKEMELQEARLMLAEAQGKAESM